MTDADQPLRVLIADDHGVIRGGLRALLESEPGIEVVAEAADVAETLRSVLGHKPDVLLLDLNMPSGSTLPEIPSLLERSPNTRIVVLTMQDDPEFARQALRSGATGYVLKEAADEELLEAVRAAADGKTYINPSLGVRLATAPERPSGPPGGLSDREAEVLRLIALGYTNAEIAERLYLSVRTIETHRAHIQQKLGVTSRSELVRFALEHGLVQT